MLFKLLLLSFLLSSESLEEEVENQSNVFK